MKADTSVINVTGTCSSICVFLSRVFSVITGWETNNKYRVRNTLGQQVYFAAEGEWNTQGIHIS